MQRHPETLNHIAELAVLIYAIKYKRGSFSCLRWLLIHINKAKHFTFMYRHAYNLHVPVNPACKPT